MSSTINARKEILDRLRVADLPKDVLIGSVVDASECDRQRVLDAYDGLKKTGEVYEVENEVRKT